MKGGMRGAVLLPVALVAALTLAACGRRGAPQRPPEAAEANLTPVDPREPSGEQAPDRSFVLDPILQ